MRASCVDESPKTLVGGDVGEQAPVGHISDRLLSQSQVIRGHHEDGKLVTDSIKI